MQGPIEPGSLGTTPDGPPDADLPLLDLAVMRDWADDMERHDVLAVLACVPQESGKCLADLRKAIVAGDLAGARRSAHRLKGMAANLGATRLSRMARAIEVGSHSIDDVCGRMPMLEDAASQTLEAIRALP